MSESDWKVLEAYVAETARTMGLTNWTIRVKREPATDGNNAECGWTCGRALGFVRIASYFLTLNAEEQRSCIVHELLHLAFANAWDTVEEDLDKSELLGKSAYAIFYQSFTRQMEYSIDATAGAIAQFLPLISWETEAAATDTPPVDAPITEAT